VAVGIQILNQLSRTENTQNENRFSFWCEMDYVFYLRLKKRGKIKILIFTVIYSF
jgi:hypothetical protein